MSRFVLAVSCVVVLFLSACAPPPRGPAKKENPTSEKTVFPTAKAIGRNVPVSLQATGAFIAEESSDIAPAVGGRVASTPAEVGDYVRKGQAICVLEQREAQLKLDQARAGREQARFLLSQAQSRVNPEQNCRPRLIIYGSAHWRAKNVGEV